MNYNNEYLTALFLFMRYTLLSQFRLNIIKALTVIFMGFLTSCSMNVSNEELKAYLDKDHEVLIVKPTFEKAHLKQLLTSSYDGKKNSLIVISDFDKDALKFSGLTTSYIELFSVVYDDKGLKVDSKIPVSALPPVNQILLDIILSQADIDYIRKMLPEGYTVCQKLLNENDKADSTGYRLILTDKSKEIYKIEYKFKHGLNLAYKISNYSYNYTITIKYL